MHLRDEIDWVETIFNTLSRGNDMASNWPEVGVVFPDEPRDDPTELPLEETPPLRAP